MINNYNRILEIIENPTEEINVDSEEVTQLMMRMTHSERQDIVLYCQKELKKINKKLIYRNFKHGMLGGGLAIIPYIALCYFFPELTGDTFFQFFLVLPCVYLVFCLRPKNPPLIKQESRYKQFKARFSSN